MYGTYFGLYLGHPQIFQHKNQMKEDTIIQLVTLTCMLHVWACTQACQRHVNTTAMRGTISPVPHMPDEAQR
jgi:hypothetical protein